MGPRPSLTFSPSPTIKDLEGCSSIKCIDSGGGGVIGGHLAATPTPTHNTSSSMISNNNCVKIDIVNNCSNNHNLNHLNYNYKEEKFSKLTKVKGYFCQIGIFVLELFIALFCYIFGIFLFLNVLLAALFSWLLRLCVKLIFTACYHYIGEYKVIERGADALWAAESGIGASSSNIVIGLKCKGCPDLGKIVRTFETKVLNFGTRLRVKKENGSYVQEESGEIYEPYQKLRWIICEKFFFFCLKRDENFRIENHFSLEEIKNDNECENEQQSLDDGMRRLMEKCITTKMTPDLPQWRFQIVTNKKRLGSEYGIIFTIHHSYGDGISWVQMFRYAFADHPVKSSIDPMGKSPSLSSHYFSSSEPLGTRILRWVQTVILFPHYFSRQMVHVWREANFFHGPFVKNNGTCRWNSTLSMKQIKAIRVLDSSVDHQDKAIKPTFTALLSSCITAAFTKLFRDYQARVPGKVLAVLPYADLPYKTLHPLNNFYSHFLPMPTSVTNSRARLVQCDNYAKSFNPPPTKPVNTALAHLCGIMITPLQKLMGLSARSTVGFSNVPGPAEKIKLFGGDEVTSLILFPPLKYRTAIVVGFISYGDQLTMSICVDETIRNHSLFASKFMEYFQEELKSLIDRSTGLNGASDEASGGPKITQMISEGTDHEKSCVMIRVPVPAPRASLMSRDFVVGLHKDASIKRQSRHRANDSDN